jgi:glycosyltransferase involved in cell wall biosynthesis
MAEFSQNAHLMTTHPKISVIIPCFNAEQYIVAAVHSVLAQNWPNLEIVVVDDGSSDHSAELVRNTFPEVRLIQQTNQGVAFLDADDIWLPGKLQAQYHQLISVPDARMSYTAWQVWASTEPAPSPEYIEGLIRRSGDTKAWTGATGWIYPQLLLDCEVWTSTVLAHRSVFAEVGQFDPALRIGEDYDLWLRASRVTQILRVPAPYALYRSHPTSITKSVLKENYRSLVVERAIARWGYSSVDGTTAHKGAVNRALAKNWSDFAGAQLAAGNQGRALAAGFLAVRADWRHAGGWKVVAKSAARSLVGRAQTKPCR